MRLVRLRNINRSGAPDALATPAKPLLFRVLCVELLSFVSETTPHPIPMISRIPVCIIAAAFGAVSSFADVTLSPNGTVDRTSEINTALSSAANTIVTLNPGQYNHSGVITIPAGKTLRSLSSTNRAVLYATNTINIAVRLTGASPRLENMVVTTNYSGGFPLGSSSPNRTSANEDCLVWADNATNFNIRSVKAYNGRAGGIKARLGGGTSDTVRAYIQDCEVYDTLADGIHLAKGVSFVNVVNNDVHHTGDDMIAIVSYYDNGTTPICSNNKILDNTLGSNRHARGISVIGGYDIVVANNVIDSPWGSGIHVGSDGGAYVTHRAEWIYLNDNDVLNPNRGKGTSNAGIVLTGRNPVNGVEFLVTKVRMYRNTIIGSTGDNANDIATICHGVRIGDGANTTTNRLVSDVVMEDTFISTAKVGISISHTQDVTIRARPGNTASNKSSQIGYTFDQAIATNDRCRGTIVVQDTHMDGINKLKPTVPPETSAQNVDLPAIYIATPVSPHTLVSQIARNHLNYPQSDSLSRLIIAPYTAPNSAPDPGAGNKNTYGGTGAPALISDPTYLQ